MDKEQVLKAFYISQITQLMERCTDTSMLDLIYRLLNNEINGGTNK